ncbi:MAG: hypothetical protein GEU78_19895, partial [Actinobacteria bacterium]|nr:hypothetical protein [Actinomycetota bacterium]
RNRPVAVASMSESRPDVAEALDAIPEILQVHGLSGQTDLLVHVVAVDADDLYRVAGQILASPGVERTNTALVMRDLVDYRLTPLLRRAAGGPLAGDATRVASPGPGTP